MEQATYTLAGYEMETPLVSAAGAVNDANPEVVHERASALLRTSIGAITLGSFTVLPRAGNEAEFGGPVYYHDRGRGETYNSMGLPNPRIETAAGLTADIVEEAHARDMPKIVIASVSPTQYHPDIGDASAQVQYMMQVLQPTGVDCIEVNTACPNEIAGSGDRHPILGYDVASMERLLKTIEPFSRSEDARIGIKLPPYMTPVEYEQARGLSRLLLEYRAVHYLASSNTIANQIPRDENGNEILSVPGGKGGMSGPATRETGREQLVLWKNLVGEEMDIISMLGMDSGRELAIRRHMGAAAAGGVTFLWESDDWADKVTNVMVDYAEQAV